MAEIKSDVRLGDSQAAVSSGSDLPPPSYTVSDQKKADATTGISFVNHEDVMHVRPNFLTYLAIFLAMMGAMMFGLDQGNFGNIQSFTDFENDWCVDHGYGDEITCHAPYAANNSDWQNNFILWGNSLITFGAAAGALLLAPLIAPHFGRRPCIATGAGIVIIGCIIAAVSKNVPLFFIARFVTGFGVGVTCYALPVYNSEMATPSIRGSTGGLFQFNVVIGSFFATIITLYLKVWQVAICLPAFPALFLVVGIWFLPESPRFVMRNKSFEEGERVLQKIRSGDSTPEAREIQEALKLEEDEGQLSYLELMRDPSLRYRVFVTSFLQVAQQLTGVNAFLGYASTIFGLIGITDPLTFNVIWNSVMVVGVIIGLIFLDSKWGGRRRQLLIATVLMGPALIIGGAALLANWPAGVTMVMVCLFGLGFQFAWGPVPWLYPSEIFPMNAREKACSIAVFWQYLFNAVVVIATPHLYTWSVGGTILVFAGLNCLNFVFVFFCIKETKGVPLEEVPALFGARTATQDQFAA